MYTFDVERKRIVFIIDAKKTVLFLDPAERMEVYSSIKFEIRI